jgi:G8 domain-containing protein
VAWNRSLPGALIALVLLLAVASPAAAEVKASASGPWSDPGTWGGRVPGPEDEVTVAGGWTVTVDGDARAASVHVAEGGTLAFAQDRSAGLELGGNLVVEGTLRMVAPDPRVQQTIRFVGVDEGAVRGGGHEVLDSDVGLWAHHHGQLDIRGAAKTSWSRTTGAKAGDRRLTLEAPPVGWRAGDELVVVPSLPPTSDDFSTAFDQAKVRSVEGAEVGIDRPLAYDHPAPGGLHPEVLNLTRNVRIGGTPDGHAHLMSMAEHKQIVDYAELRYVGVPGKQGRYGLHFHEAGDGSRGSQVVGTVVRDAGNHAFVAHASHGVQFRQTISYNTQGDAYWWDPGPDTNDVVYDWAVAAKVTAPEDADAATRFRLTGFRLMQGRGDAVRNSVAVGVQGEVSSAGFHWPEEVNSRGDWTFQGNVGHNNLLNGAFSWQNDSLPHDVVNSVFYHNGEYGIDHGAYLNTYHFSGVTLYGNGQAGLNLRAGSRESSGGRGLHFDDLLFDGAGISEHGIVADEHTLPPEDGATTFSRTELRGSTGAEVAMGPADVPYAIDLTDSNVGSYAVSGDGNRLQVNGDQRSGSGRVAAAVKLEQPGAPPLAPISAPAGLAAPPAAGHDHGGSAAAPAKATTTTAHRHDVPAAVTAHLETEGHHHGEGLFGLTIPLLDEPLDAKHAIGFGVLAVLIPLLCYASVRIDRRYQRRMQQLRAARAQRPAPPPPPVYSYGGDSGGEDDWWGQSASRWRSDTPSWP